MSAIELQALLRFLSQDAKVPLATAMSKVKELQKHELDSPDKLSKAKADQLAPIFTDMKLCKQIIAAAKRVSKKRAAGDDGVSSPSKRKRKDLKLFNDDEVDTPEKLEASVALPASEIPEADLAEVVVFTNRAPLVLAFIVILVKHTMPEQPLTSRLSLAQAYVSITSRSRAVYLGIENGKSAEEEGFGEGQPKVTIMGKDIHVLKRWGYEWKDQRPETQSPSRPRNAQGMKTETEGLDESEPAVEEQPALWALDLEAQRKYESGETQNPASGSQTNMPIFTPQSARNYLLKSFNSPPKDDTDAPKKSALTAKTAEKEQNLGKLLQALDLLYDSWAGTLTPDELDKRTWTWYVKVRPDVEDGVAGWGGKNRVKLSDILDLRQAT